MEIKEYPQILYCNGNQELLNKNKIVAIVGSRNCTEYGRKYAQIFAEGLSKRNVCIISGLAVGIDAAAHDAATQKEGGTIAVLGGGFKNIYPRENVWLYNEILQQNGCVISEYGENEETRTSNFPKRNRIISGIADAVLVIEASHRSGSRITAEYAIKQGKKLYCIPCNLDQQNSSGINELIERGAKIVSSPAKLYEDLYGKENEDSQGTDEQDTVRNYNNQIEDEKTLKELLIYRMLGNPMTAEEIATRLNKKIEDVDYILTIMELEGKIKKKAGNIFLRMEKNV